MSERLLDKICREVDAEAAKDKELRNPIAFAKKVAKSYTLQVVREAVDAEWDNDDTPERMATAECILTRIEKLTEES